MPDGPRGDVGVTHGSDLRGCHANLHAVLTIMAAAATAAAAAVAAATA